MLDDHQQSDEPVPPRSSTEVPLVIAGPGVVSGSSATARWRV